jgi:hypothetical protein
MGFTLVEKPGEKFDLRTHCRSTREGQTIIASVIVASVAKRRSVGGADQFWFLAAQTVSQLGCTATVWHRVASTTIEEIPDVPVLRGGATNQREDQEGRQSRFGCHIWDRFTNKRMKVLNGETFRDWSCEDSRAEVTQTNSGGEQQQNTISLLFSLSERRKSHLIKEFRRFGDTVGLQERRRAGKKMPCIHP